MTDQRRNGNLIVYIVTVSTYGKDRLTGSPIIMISLPKYNTRWVWIYHQSFLTLTNLNRYNVVHYCFPVIKQLLILTKSVIINGVIRAFMQFRG
jgi:hypothetical protein